MANPYISNVENDESARHMPDWRELVAILMERAWIGLAVALAVVALSYIHLRRTVPLYRSTAVLLVEAQSAKIMNYQDVFSANLRNLEYFNTAIKTLHSRTMMEAAVKNSGLMEHPDFFPGMTSVVQKAASIRPSVSIEPVQKSRLINVSVINPEPEIAAEFANAMAKAYIQQGLDNRMNTSIEAVEWLRKKSDEYRVKLEAGVRELQEYREKAGSVSLEEDQNIVIAKLKSLNETLTQAQTRRITAEARWTAVQTQFNENASRDHIAVQLDDEGVQSALHAWRKQRQHVAELKQRYKGEYPELAEEIKKEEALEKCFEESCELAVFALQSQYNSDKATETALQVALEQQEGKAFELARQLVRYNDLKRNVEADQNIYQAMISRMKETHAAESLPQGVIRLAEEARPASQPFVPSPGRVMLRGMLLGVVAGVGVIVLLYLSDHRFRRNEEVERALGVPVLGALPYITGKDVHDRGMFCHLHTSGEVPEAFRTLRAVLQVMPATKKARVFLVTSTQPGEGKSLVSTNLAITFSQNGLKTLLIGGDMRRPAFKAIFRVDSMPAGLSEVLKGKTTWRDVLESELVPGLDIMPAGAIPSQPAELIDSARMSTFMSEARDTYDRIVIDSSPMLGVSDSLLLMKHADGVIFVVRQGVTHSLGAVHARRRIADGDTPCFGAIMNGVNLKSLSNYYYYKRYGGYEYRQYQNPVIEASA